ncbi:hypothetical protein GYMLUDRAFT_206759 [Collybiopsis luxurians FD-317 M1]|uniref:DUF6534 domain-containing protein n=1 Tax=Collybiopsis luxurians FD-317 M1 TaxID=944289 RepID=A0A0D0CHB1_9AGAR|nr:hypothetical protein GYMLUDRAFT_206759 [Collybiopsis luxurians FD-317 M1]
MTLGPAEIAHGPMYIGQVFNTTLFGILSGQVYWYSVTSTRKDPAWIQILVYALYLVNVISTVFVIVYLYDAVIQHFDDPAYLTKATWVFAIGAPLTGVTAALCQSFFAWRIQTLTKNTIAAVVVGLATVIGLTGSISSAAHVPRFPRFTEFMHFKASVLTWLFGQIAADVIITTVLVIYLQRHRTGFQKTDQLINRIIQITIQTGLITTLCAMADAVCFLASTSGIHLIFNFSLGKLYSVALMSNLNARASWSHSSDSRDGEAQLFLESPGLRFRGGTACSDVPTVCSGGENASKV